MNNKIAYSLILLFLLSFACQCEHGNIESCLSSYVEKNESKMEMLRSWDIYYEPERNFWSCKHWYTRDSLLTFINIRIDKQDTILCMNHLYKTDSIFETRTAIENVATLFDIKCICESNGIGTHEVFNDTLSYNYIIIVRKQEEQYQLIHVKEKDITHNRHLYENWYFSERKNTTEREHTVTQKPKLTDSSNRLYAIADTIYEAGEVSPQIVNLRVLYNNLKLWRRN